MGWEDRELVAASKAPRGWRSGGPFAIQRRVGNCTARVELTGGRDFAWFALANGGGLGSHMTMREAMNAAVKGCDRRRR